VQAQHDEAVVIVMALSMAIGDRVYTISPATPNAGDRRSSEDVISFFTVGI
jgi:hypothetical protein